MFTFVGTKYSRQMASLDQLYNLVKQINEKLNLWTANAKKVEELPTMETMNPDGLLMVSEQVAGIWTSKQLEIQKIIDGLSLSGQDNKVREVLLGSITVDHDLAYLLDNNGITVSENEIVVITALETVNATLVQRQYLWKKGKGAYNPIGSTDINTKLIELQPRFLNEITADELTSSPSAIVYDFGIITDPILDVLNTADPARDYTDDERIYYIRATKDGVNLLYNFVGTNGTYGDGELQMTEDDLVLVYSSASVDITDSLLNKLDKGSFYGKADDLIDKNTYSWTNVNTLSGVVVDYVNPFVGMSINFKDAVTELHSLSFPTVAKRPYFGALGFIKNSQSIDILIPHKELSLVANRYVFAFPDEQDLVLKPNEILFFKADPDETHSYGYLDVICVYNNGTSTPLATDAVSGTVKTDIEEADPIVYTKTTMDTLLADKVDKDGAKVLSDNNYTTSEKNKLASIDSTHYLAPLQTTVQLSAIPQADLSDKARVYIEDDLSDYFYDATASSGDIAPDDQAGGIGFWRKVAVGGETPTSIKTKYESNADTNAYTDADKAKVAATSGTNSGDETTSTIKSKLDITTLSGSNTGDETATTLGILIGAAADATPNDSDFLATSLTAGGILKKITWANVKAFLKTYFDGQYSPKDRLSENTTVTGAYNLDWSYETHRLTLTGTTTLTDINLPATGFTKTITLHVNGNFSLTYPAGWTTYISGAYVGTSPLNTIVAEYIKNGVYKIQISQ